MKIMSSGRKPYCAIIKLTRAAGESWGQQFNWLFLFIILQMIILDKYWINPQKMTIKGQENYKAGQNKIWRPVCSKSQL